MPFPPWLYFCIINQQFTVFSYKSLPGYKDRILENRSTPSAAGTEELGDGHAEEEVGGGGRSFTTSLHSEFGMVCCFTY